MKQENKEAQYREDFHKWFFEDSVILPTSDSAASIKAHSDDYRARQESYLAGRLKGQEELLAATRKIMNAKECTCEAMPSINECPFHLHKEISKQDDQIESLKKENESLACKLAGKTSSNLTYINQNQKLRSLVEQSIWLLGENLAGYIITEKSKKYLKQASEAMSG